MNNNTYDESEDEDVFSDEDVYEEEDEL